MLTVKSIPTTLPRLVIIPSDYTLIAYFRRSMANGWIGVAVAYVEDLHAPRHVGSHDVASGLVEDRLGYARVSGAECFPVAVGSVARRIVAVAYET